MLLRHAVGAALRRIRLDRGLTLREVAAAARVSMPYLSEIERGRKEPSSEVLAGVCVALGLTIVDLLAQSAAEIRAGEALVVDLTTRRDELSVGAADENGRRAMPRADRGVQLAA
jgi:transcriptional regulator with XRE-family HTH domain